MQQGPIKLIKSERKAFVMLFKIFIFQKNYVYLNFLFIKESCKTVSCFH